MITEILKTCLPAGRDYSDFTSVMNLWNLYLITVIRSFPFAYSLKVKFLEEPDCFQLVTENTCYKFGKASYFMLDKM